MQKVWNRLDEVIDSIATSVDRFGDFNDFNVGFLIDGPGHLLMSTCLFAIWKRAETAADELLNRLRNAVVLLSQADKIALEPVALSLSFAAIEALVCEKDEVPTTKQFMRHVSTLLVQDTAGRKKKERIIRELYEIRSGVLHGSKIDWPHAGWINVQARTIASGVILAVICWRQNQSMSGGDTSWKELLDELNAASRKPGIVVGVPDLSDLFPDKL
jgi:hypothetical protein